MVSLLNYNHSSQCMVVFYTIVVFHSRCIVVLICTSQVMLSVSSCVNLPFLHPIWHLCQIQFHSDILSYFLEMSQHQLLGYYILIYDTFQINYFYIVWIRSLSYYYFAYGDPIISAISVEKIILFSLNCLGTIVQVNWLHICESVSESLFVNFIFFIPVPHCLECCSFYKLLVFLSFVLAS